MLLKSTPYDPWLLTSYLGFLAQPWWGIPYSHCRASRCVGGFGIFDKSILPASCILDCEYRASASLTGEVWLKSRTALDLEDELHQVQIQHVWLEETGNTAS